MAILKVSDRKEAARQFVSDWKNRGNEIEDYQEFWEDLLEDVFGIPKARKEIRPQQTVKVAKSTKRMDILLKTSKVVIEQKSRGIDLEKEEKSKGGSPVDQVKFYHEKMDKDKSGRYAIACNFAEFKIWDSYNKTADIKTIKLEELPKRWKELRFLIEPYKPEGYIDPEREEKVASRASDYIQNLYNVIYESKQDWSKQELQWLNMFCVRVVFCLYAEDAGLFGDEQFSSFIEKTPADEMSDRFNALFIWLDSNESERKELSAVVGKIIRNFPWVNGGLFDKKVDYKTPEINEAARNILLNADNLKMDNGEIFSWEEISPTNFGCIFESTVDIKVRDSGGMHYTTPENIQRAINPLFLDELTTELNGILKLPIGTEGEKDVKYFALETYRKKLASLRFLDPACGSGNFLTETYKALHQLELQTIESELEFRHGLRFGNENPCYVRMGQFFGIENDHFAASVARASLWIADCQLLKETKKRLKCEPDILPLEKNNNIHCADALYTDWDKVLKRKKSTPIFIIGNPPFKGARGGKDTVEEKEQKKQAMHAVMNELDYSGKPVWDHVGDLDFVCAWYAKAAQYMQGFPLIKAALVSTNSIVQGEHAINLWKPLMLHYGVIISFAWRTFPWFNKAKNVAQVHCVIIGFYCAKRAKTQSCYIFQESMPTIECKHINNYLIPSNSYFINPDRRKPVCDVPIIGIGNKPIDDGNYLFTEKQKDDFIAKEPQSASYFHKWYGSIEFTTGVPRYCLWLGECEPDVLDKMPLCKKRRDAVARYREKSDSEQTRKLAKKPTRFHVENMPKGDYLLIPETTSKRRYYVPFGYMTPDVFCSNLVRLMPNVTPYHFGILSSKIHMAWMRVVCGRMKSDYRYSIEIVYNNFPWPSNITDAEHQKIEDKAQNIISVRAKHKSSTLKQLYAPETMPSDLVDAHEANDKAVFAAYAYLGICPNMTDEEIAMILLRESVRLAKLSDRMKRMKKVTKKKTKKK